MPASNEFLGPREIAAGRACGAVTIVKYLEEGPIEVKGQFQSKSCFKALKTSRAMNRFR